MSDEQWQKAQHNLPKISNPSKTFRSSGGRVVHTTDSQSDRHVFAVCGFWTSVEASLLNPTGNPCKICARIDDAN